MHKNFFKRYHQSCLQKERKLCFLMEARYWWTYHRVPHWFLLPLSWREPLRRLETPNTESDQELAATLCQRLSIMTPNHFLSYSCFINKCEAFKKFLDATAAKKNSWVNKRKLQHQKRWSFTKPKFCKTSYSTMFTKPITLGDNWNTKPNNQGWLQNLPARVRQNVSTSTNTIPLPVTTET